MQVAQLEDFRQMRVDELAVLIQKTFRAWSTAVHFIRMKDAQVKIANAWRRYKVRCGEIAPVFSHGKTSSFFRNPAR